MEHLKKLLVFSILFLTCSLGLKSVKADTSLDNYNFYNNSWLVSYNIFDTEVYNYGNYNGSNIHYKTYTEDYIDNYNSLVNFFKENDYYYIFGNDKVAFWTAEGLEPITYAYSDDEGAWLSSTLYNPNKDIVYYAYYSSELNSSNILNKKYGSRDIFCADGNSIFRIKSGTNSSYASYTTRYSINGYSVVLDANVGIRFDTNYFLSKKNYSSMTDDVRTYYHSITVNNKTYNSGDYIYRGSSKVGNPKVTNIDYYIENNVKYGVSITVDYNAIDKNRYSYYISFGENKNFIDISSKVENGIYNFKFHKNFVAYFKLVDNLEGKEAYSTLTIDSIDENYIKHSATFTENYNDDDYYIKDDIKYLKKLELTLSINNYKPDLFKYWVSIGNSNNFTEIYYNSWLHTFYKNTTIYYKVTDNFGNYVYASTYQIARLSAISTVAQDVLFEETCYTKPWEDDDHSSVGQQRCIVSAEFINPDDFRYNYYIDNGDGNFFQITMSDLNNNIYKNDTSVITTLTIRITDKNGKEVLLKSYTNTGFKNHEDSFSNILNSFVSPISNIFHVFYTLFTSFPMGIRNMFSAILFISLSIVLIKLLL